MSLWFLKMTLKLASKLETRGHRHANVKIINLIGRSDDCHKQNLVDQESRSNRKEKKNSFFINSCFINERAKEEG